MKTIALLIVNYEFLIKKPFLLLTPKALNRRMVWQVF